MKIIESIQMEENEILVVDDQAQNLKILYTILESSGYHVRIANNGKKAIETLRRKRPGLVLLDVNMPNIDGISVAETMKSDPYLFNIPIIFVTALTDIETKIRAFKVGGLDYITKPYIKQEIIARVSTHLRLSKFRKLLEIENEVLQMEVNKKVEELSSTQQIMIRAMIELAETRDDETGKHINRISLFCERLAILLYKTKRYQEIDTDFISAIKIASPLHDIGKIGIRDKILLKPGKLTSAEFEKMKEHVSIGADKLFAISGADPENSYLKMGANIAKYHHERYDGSGYLCGLKGDEIPIEARIMIIADVYDAIRSKRVYKEAFNHEKTMEIMSQDRGKAFDPDVFDIFEADQEWFRTTFDLSNEEAET